MNKKRLIGICMVLVMLIGCGGLGQFIKVDLNQEALTEIAAGGLASYIGYEGYKANPQTFEAAYKIATGNLKLNEKVNAIRDKIADDITNHPVLKQTATDLLKTIKIDVTVDEIVVAPDQEGLVGAMIQKFAMGIEMAKMGG